MKSVRVIKTIQELEEFVLNFSAPEIAADTETTALETHLLELVCISLYAPELPEPVVIPFNFKAKYMLSHREGRKVVKVEMGYEAKDRLDWNTAKPLIRKLFEGRKTIWANGKFDKKVAKKYGWDCFKITDDTQVMAYLRNPDDGTGLKENATKYLKIKMESYAETTGMKDGNIIWPQVNWKNYYLYAGRDAYATYHLRNYFLPVFENDQKLNGCYRHIELPLIPVIAESEYRGVKIDKKFMRDLASAIRSELAIAEQKIYDAVGEVFNLGSPKQLAEVLFDRLGYPVISTTAKGDRSVDEATLKELSFRGYKVADLIVYFRELTKLLGTYVENIFEMLDDKGMLHGSFNATFTRTGRMCVDVETLIETDRGLVRIGDLIPNTEGVTEVTGFKALTHEWEFMDITHAINKGEEEMFEVELENGRVITCTEDHKFLTSLGWLSLKEVISLQTESTEVSIICADYGSNFFEGARPETEQKDDDGS